MAVRHALDHFFEVGVWLDPVELRGPAAAPPTLVPRPPLKRETSQPSRSRLVSVAGARFSLFPRTIQDDRACRHDTKFRNQAAWSAPRPALFSCCRLRSNEPDAQPLLLPAREADVFGPIQRD